jgi:hypothetical protein
LQLAERLLTIPFQGIDLLINILRGILIAMAKIVKIG